uniref:Uncharacterized protein n=1 Tax=Tetradesmus obliquus TaxID=3088 RepID=A0A383W0A3_TETOB|eukprot:jgi/Sobl393_1/7031/SZX70533.1
MNAVICCVISTGFLVSSPLQLGHGPGSGNLRPASEQLNRCDLFREQLNRCDLFREQLNRCDLFSEQLNRCDLFRERCWKSACQACVAANGTEVPEDLKFLAELGRLGWSAAAKAIAAAEKNKKEKKKEVSAAEDEQAKQEQQQMQRLQQMGIDKVNTPAAAGTSPKRKSQKNKKRAGAAQSPKSPGSGKRTSNSPAGQRDGKKQKHR